MTGVVLIIGVALIVLSALNSSSFLAIFGVTIIFWGAIFLYVTPSKHVPLTLLNASAEAAADNIERLISGTEPIRERSLLASKEPQEHRFQPRIHP